MREIQGFKKKVVLAARHKIFFKEGWSHEGKALAM